MKSLSQHINEAVDKKLTSSAFVKMIKDDTEWGDLGSTMRVVKGNVEVADGYFYGGEDALKKIISKWSPKGEYYEYFKQHNNIEFEIIDSFNDIKATSAWYKNNISTDGIVSVTLKIK